MSEKKEMKNLLYCECCLQINDPETEEGWVNGEKFREKNIGDRRLIDGGITSLDHCPECELLVQSDKEFHLTDYEENNDGKGFASL